MALARCYCRPGKASGNPARERERGREREGGREILDGERSGCAMPRLLTPIRELAILTFSFQFPLFLLEDIFDDVFIARVNKRHQRETHHVDLKFSNDGKRKKRLLELHSRLHSTFPRCDLSLAVIFLSL